MKVEVKLYSSNGHDVLLAYDPTTANMKEVNAFIDQLEKNYSGRTFEDSTGEVINEVTPQTGDMTFVRPIAGG